MHEERSVRGRAAPDGHPFGGAGLELFQHGFGLQPRQTGEDIEKRILEKALVEAKYNKTEAARQLGISFRSLRYKLKKFDID